MKRDRLLLVSALVQFALFVPVTLWARKHRRSLSEIILSQHFQKQRPSFVRSLILVINSSIASEAATNILALPIAFFLWMRRLRLEALMTIIMCWTSGLVRQVIKKIVDRPRPNPLLVHAATHPKTKSFPSGDVAASVCFWGWLMVLGWRTRSTRRECQASKGKAAFLGIPALMVMLIGPARIYLGAHWLTDVVGGYLFGGGWLSLTLHFYFRWRQKCKDAFSV
jgi:membrane-associated phospholipid phosphatase